MKNLLDLLAVKHKTWVEITMSFDLDKSTAEDIVQDMYIKLYNWSVKNEGKASIMYNEDEVNYYFVFKTLRTLFYDYNRKANRNIKIPEAASEELREDYIYEAIDKDIHEANIKKALENMYWYDKKVFDLVYRQGWSMLQLSSVSGISYYSIYRTIQKVKKTIKKQICE